ncbi:hypothetical protein CJ030_MR6G020127 [Morella rubra]|uniref:Uncharacterized protein n=1 Tax=Morella rubra TaxID=262757 RepID=A0A6A1VB57_9ROSI|nr:hypothetical protein CJ030_MR6G020127 [Morella rubra]
MAPRRRASSSSQAAQPKESLSLAQHQALIYKRPVVIERVFRLRDFNELEYEGQSIQSNFEERGWAQFLGSTGDVYVDLVRDFYAQVLTVDANVEELTIQVRGVFFTLSANIIAQFIGLLRPQVPAYPTIGPPFDMTPEEVWKEVAGADMIVSSTLICHRDMLSFFRMLHLIIVWDVAPRHHAPSSVSSVDSFSLWLCVGLRLISQLLLFSRYFEMYDEDAMDGGPPLRSQPTRRGRSSTYEVGQSSSSQVEHPPWKNMLVDEITARMGERFNKIEEEIHELRKERDT